MRSSGMQYYSNMDVVLLENYKKNFYCFDDLSGSLYNPFVTGSSIYYHFYLN